MRIVYLGNNDRGVRCLKALLGAGHTVAGVIAHPDSRDKTFYASVKESALSLGIPVIQPELAADAAETVRRWEPELVVLSGYSKILPKSMLKIAPLGCINLHGGKLPQYRGAAPMNWMIINGETEGGLCVIRVDEGIDTGDILAQERYAIGRDDTIADILALTLERFPPMLLRVLDEMQADSLNPLPQDPLDGTTYCRRTPADGVICWREKTAAEVYNLIRALTRPYPGAFTHLDGCKAMIWRSRLLDERIVGTPGRVVSRHRDERFIMCRDRAVAVSDITDAAGEPIELPLGADLQV